MSRFKPLRNLSRGIRSQWRHARQPVRRRLIGCRNRQDSLVSPWLADQLKPVRQSLR
jgi:hypothetical protein